MKRDAGFTLLELLVGLVVLSFILAGLSQSVRFGLRVGETQTRQSDGRSELDGIDRTLRRLIEQADPGNAYRSASMQGRAGTLAFTSKLPTAGGVERPANIVIEVDAGQRLILRWSVHRHVIQDGPDVEENEVALLQGVSGLQISYWQEGWRTQWIEANLPVLVRFRFSFPPGDPRHWQDIVVETRRKKDRGLS